MSGPFFEASSMDGGNQTMMRTRKIEEGGRERKGSIDTFSGEWGERGGGDRERRERESEDLELPFAKHFSKSINTGGCIRRNASSTELLCSAFIRHSM